MDETRIDAAPTPAHVFAYRAFRSVFVASPESSPIRPQTTLYDNKENTYVSSLQYKKTSNSPANVKRKSPGKDLLSLTPKRQKTIPISPTKSILKNPNAPTPRRPDLRDLSVTFKDIRKSASPDLAQRLTVMSIKGPSGLRIASEPVIDSKTEEGSLKPGSSFSVTAHIPPLEVIEQEHAAMVADIVRNPAFDVNDYVVKTEKELRRFAAYGKKWKKHAQKQDQEIERLKALLEDAREENQQLRQKLVHGDDELSSLNSGRIATVEKEFENSVKKTPSLISKEIKTGKSSRNGGRKPESASNVSTLATDAATAAVDRPRTPKSGPLKSVDEEHLQKAERLKFSPSTMKGASATTYGDRSAHLKSRDIKSPLIQQGPAILDKSLDILSELPLPPASSSLAPSSSAASTSLTLDRQAAARERLRQKAEDRKASMRLNLAPTSTITEKPHRPPPPSLPIIDESELDWADLEH